MKQYNNILIFMIGALSVIFSSCTENEREFYSEKQSVYFTDYSDNEQDSTIYSFAGSSSNEAKVNLSVSLMGAYLTKDAKFKIVVNSAKTDAVAGTDYAVPSEYYTFPANATKVDIPITIYKNSPSLENGHLTLALTLKATEELDIAYSYRKNIRVIFTNKLIKPSYWDMILVLYFGTYSKVKHEYLISLMHKDFPLTLKEITDIQYLMSIGRKATKYYLDNIVYDENGNRITPWNAF